jgi:hypothetical protein
LRESLWRHLAVLATRVERRELKRSLDDFASPLFDSLTDPNESHAAREAALAAIQGLSQLVGRGVYEARLPPHLRDVLNTHPALREEGHK